MREWIESRLKEIGETKASLGRALGVPFARVHDLVQGKRELKLSETYAFSRFLKMDVEEVIANFDGRPFKKSASRNIPALTTTHKDGIPQLDIHAGLGNGGLLDIEVDPHTMKPLPEYTTGDWSFPAEIEGSIGAFKGKFAFRVIGDSMAPTLQGGWTVFVDTLQNKPSPPGIFAIDAGDGLLVKRVELIPQTEKIRIISDNQAYNDYEFMREDVRVYGRVFGYFAWVS